MQKKILVLVATLVFIFVSLFGFFTYSNNKNIELNNLKEQNKLDSNLKEKSSISKPDEKLLEKSKNKNCAKPVDSPLFMVYGINHLQYDEVNEDDLVLYGTMLVHKELSQAFKIMYNQAKKEGIELSILSGYRSVSSQKNIIQTRINNGENEKEIYKSNAYAGYSEHHTGYAIDINDINAEFADSKEGKWVASNSLKYGFRISFPINNVQKLSFEPWHLRYIGSANAQKIFCYAEGLI